MEEEKFTIDEYFRSEKDKLIFALIYTDKSLRESPDICKIPGADNAIKKLNELYDHMTEKDEEDGGNDEQ